MENWIKQILTSYLHFSNQRQADSFLVRCWRIWESPKDKLFTSPSAKVGWCVNSYWNPVEWVVAEYNKFANINCSLKSKEGIDALPLTEHCTQCKFKSVHTQMDSRMFKSLSVPL